MRDEKLDYINSVTIEGEVKQHVYCGDFLQIGIETKNPDGSIHLIRVGTKDLRIIVKFYEEDMDEMELEQGAMVQITGRLSTFNECIMYVDIISLFRLVK